MASASSKLGGLAFAIRIIVPLAVGSAGYAAYKVDWTRAIHDFATGPGRTSRILLLLFVVFNWKNLPFAWTVRRSQSPLPCPSYLFGSSNFSQQKKAPMRRGKLTVMFSFCTVPSLLRHLVPHHAPQVTRSHPPSALQAHDLGDASTAPRNRLQSPQVQFDVLYRPGYCAYSSRVVPHPTCDAQSLVQCQDWPRTRSQDQ